MTPMLAATNKLVARFWPTATLLFVVAGLLPAQSAIAATTDSLRVITERFVAPCCWRENLAVHQSPDAVKMRAEIVQLVAAGRTED